MRGLIPEEVKESTPRRISQQPQDSRTKAKWESAKHAASHTDLRGLRKIGAFVKRDRQKSLQVFRVLDRASKSVCRRCFGSEHNSGMDQALSSVSSQTNSWTCHCEALRSNLFWSRRRLLRRRRLIAMTVSILFSSEPDGHGVKLTIHSARRFQKYLRRDGRRPGLPAKKMNCLCILSI
jgi:hypothetical protein